MSALLSSEEYPGSEQDIVYALDIGTRSVIGMAARQEKDRAHILAVEKLPHQQRAMLDGQIEDIDQVAETVIEITRRLEKDTGQRLKQVCVAAAGRSLRTEKGTGRIELEKPEVIGENLIQRLTAEAVSDAESALHGEEAPDQRMLLVGYTVTRSLLDQYPMTKLQGHTGKTLEAEVVATFLPSEVVDSLNAVVHKAGLETASLTLEPIAALNAAIPPQLRLLNLVLADIGAGTSDIAVCRDGSVVGYTMATIAGDEISEALMREYLVDYDTAERIKSELSAQRTIQFQDIVGFDQSFSADEILQRIEPAVQALVQEIAQRIMQLNGGPPSAVFLAGGGSKLAGLCSRMADELGMDRRRVALAGAHFKINAYADDFSLEDPEYATPLGIAVSACLGLINGSCQVFLNGSPANLFRSGRTTVMELLMMNGYHYGDLIGRTGNSLSLYIDGKRADYHGSPAVPARLTVNGSAVPPSEIVYAGDKVDFVPAESGNARRMTAGELMKEISADGIFRRGILLDPSTPLLSGDRLTTVSAGEITENLPENSPSGGQGLRFRMNGKEMELPPKKGGGPYYLMDLLEYSGIDLEHPDHTVMLKVNGENGLFQQMIMPGDDVEIH